MVIKKHGIPAHTNVNNINFTVQRTLTFIDFSHNRYVFIVYIHICKKEKNQLKTDNFVILKGVLDLQHWVLVLEKSPVWHVWIMYCHISVVYCGIILYTTVFSIYEHDGDGQWRKQD